MCMYGLLFCLQLHHTRTSPSTTKTISSYNSSWKLQLSVCETSSAADGSVWMLWPPWPLETYINPSSLTGLSVFKVQVEGCLPSQPVVLNFHIPHWEVCKFNVHEQTQIYMCAHIQNELWPARKKEAKLQQNTMFVQDC